MKLAGRGLLSGHIEVKERQAEMAHLGVGGPLDARGLGADGEKGQAGADAAVAHDGGDVAVLLRKQSVVRNEWPSTPF